MGSDLQPAQIGTMRRRLEKCYGLDFEQHFGMDFSGILRTNFGISDDFDYKEKLTYIGRDDESQIEPDIEHADHFENHEQYMAYIDNN